MAHWQPGDAPASGFAESAAPAPPRQRRRVDVDGVVAATFGLENGGRLPHAVPLRDAVQLLVAAWDEAADWSRYESGHDPRDRGRARGPPRDWHPPLAPRRFSPEASEIIRQYHAGLRPPPPPKPHERFGNSDESSRYSAGRAAPTRRRSTKQAPPCGARSEPARGEAPKTRTLAHHLAAASGREFVPLIALASTA